VYYVLSSLDPHKAFGVDGISPALLKHCASVLTRPLHYLFSYSIHYCCLPSEWKAHCITPIFKSGDKASVSNYHPISLLCVTSKVLERIIYNNITSFIHDQISLRHFGFMKGWSTLQQLLTFLEDIHENSKIQTNVIYLDFAKAFDRVPHNELLLKLTILQLLEISGFGSILTQVTELSVSALMAPIQVIYLFYLVYSKGPLVVFNLYKWPFLFNIIFLCFFLCWWHKML